MKRQFAGFVLLLLAIPISGIGRILWISLRFITGLRIQGLFILVGLLIMVSFENPLTAQLPLDRLTDPEGRLILFGGIVALWVYVLAVGARTRTSRRIWSWMWWKGRRFRSIRRHRGRNRRARQYSHL